MIIQAKFDSFCGTCKTPITKGTKINWWGTGTKPSHQACPQAAASITATPSAPVWKTIETKFDSNCCRCKNPVKAGETVEWSKGIGIRHPGCEADQIQAALEEMASPAKQIADGTYTVIKPDGTYRTIRVHTCKDEGSPFQGRTILEYLGGPNNETDYTGFGFLTGQIVKIWKKFENNPELADDAFMLAIGNQSEMGLAYALKSNRCYRCNKKLTVPASICKGLGPVCAELVEG